MSNSTDKQAVVLSQQKRLNQIVDQIASQESDLNRLKELRNLVQQQTATNKKLSVELESVTSSVAEKDNELRQALNRVDNLTRQLTSHKRTFRNSKNVIANRKPPDRKQEKRVCFHPIALFLDAALEGELDLIVETSKKVSNLNVSHDENVTALHNAVVADQFPIVKYLVESGCDVNVQDSDGWTPLHCAASANNLPMTRYLVENGAAIFAKTFNEQRTPLSKCDNTEEGYEECCKYLESVQDDLGVVNNGRVYALYDYEATRDDELSLKMGEELYVLRRGDSNEHEWWWARKADHIARDDNSSVTIEGYIPQNMIGLYPRVKSNSTTTVTSNIASNNNLKETPKAS